MLTKILLITIFIITSWNSFQLSTNNSVLNMQIEILVKESTNLHEVTKQNIMKNQEILDKIKNLNKQVKLESIKQSSALKNVNTAIVAIQTSLNTYAMTKNASSKNTSTSSERNKNISLAKKNTLSKPSKIFQQLTSELEKTKVFYNKKMSKEMLLQLDKLKTEVWKSRKIEGASKDLVMSILSSIDITKKKWVNKEINYKLDNVEQKINKLVSTKGTNK